MNNWQLVPHVNYHGAPVYSFVLAENVNFTNDEAQDLVDHFNELAMPDNTQGVYQQVSVYITGIGWTSGGYRHIDDGPPIIKDMTFGSDGEGLELDIHIEAIKIWRVRV